MHNDEGYDGVRVLLKRWRYWSYVERMAVLELC